MRIKGLTGGADPNLTSHAFIRNRRCGFVASDVREAASMKCPLCDNSLARGDYKRAMRKLEAEAKTKADVSIQTMIKDHERKMVEVKQLHERDIREARSEYDDRVESARKEMRAAHQDQQRSIKSEYDNHLKQAQKMHKRVEVQMRRAADANTRSLKSEIGKLTREKQEYMRTTERDLRKRHAQDLKDAHRRQKQELDDANKRHSEEIAENKRRMRALEKRAQESASTAEASVRASLESELTHKDMQLREKDIQIERAKAQVEDMSRKLNQSQSEIAGEAGEQNLYNLLKQEFPMDQFRRQKRGQSSSDIIHSIREGGLAPDTRIVYDNKASATITKRDIDKAKKYRDIHNTEYSLIVSSSIPDKHARNRLFGTADGVMLVHPSIIREVATTLRKGIIAIHKASESKQVRSTKEARLYEYMASREFRDTVNDLKACRSDLESLQTKEEKQHAALWTHRKNLVDSFKKAEINIMGKVYGIVEGEVELEASVAR